MKTALAVMLGCALAGAVDARTAGAWHFEADGPLHRATIEIERGGQKSRAVVRCYRGRQLDVLVVVGPRLAGRKAPVRYRFDDDEWEQATWQTTAGVDGAFADDTRAFAQQLATRTTLSFEAKGHDGEMHAVEIPLQGARAPIERVLAACAG